MSMKVILGLLVGAAALGGGYYFVTAQQAAPETDVQETETANTAAAEGGAYTGSMADLAARGGSWKCTVDSSAQQSVSAGVAYVSGDSLRADFTTNVPGYGSVETHLIVNDGYSYSWSSAMPQGIKASATVLGEGDGAASGAAADANQSYSYQCEPWAADASIFIAPDDVTFRTL